MKIRTLAIGDIHGEYEKLKELLKLANVDFENDEVRQLGDIVDRGPEPFKCIDLLLKIKNIKFIKGNHDVVFQHYIRTNVDMFEGHHGSSVTINKWNQLDIEEQRIYEDFFYKQIPYFIDKRNNLYIHAGFDKNYLLEEQTEDTYYWDRKLIEKAMCCKDGKLKMKEHFNKIFIGHTPTICWNTTKPIYAANQIWNLDTGSGKGGSLTIMDVDTEEYWQI